MAQQHQRPNKLPLPSVNVAGKSIADRERKLPCAKGSLRYHPFKTSANFSRFLIPTLPTVSSILLQSGGKFGKFLTPSPLNNADVLNGWSLSPNPYQWQSKRHKITSPNGCAKMPLIYDAVSAHHINQAKDRRISTLL